MKSGQTGNYRWTICTLIFFATTINYLDRAVISLLKTTLEKEFRWTESDYSNIVVAFQLAYAVGLLLAGRWIDQLGTRRGYSIVLTAWSLAAMLHAFARSSFGFMVARAGLGLSEAGNFPAAIKSVAEWFPKKERALATGLFNSGANVGSILAPLLVPLVAFSLGWRWAFILTGALGFIWLFFWFRYYEIPPRQKRLGRMEYEYIQSDADEKTNDSKQGKEEPVSWIRLLRYRQTWAFVLGKFMTDPIWWFYLFWLPAFLKAQYGMEGTSISLPVATVYIISALGSISGGWLPMEWIRRGWPVFRARKTSMFIYALVPLPVIGAQWLGSYNMWWAVLLIGLATAAHAAWSANIFTTASDMFPKKTVGTVTGLGGMSGALGGMLIAWLAGKLLDHFKALGNLETGYTILFVICGLAYITAWLVMHLLAPKMKQVNV